MNHEPIHYNYAALFQGVLWLVLFAVVLIIAINYRWWPRGSKWLSGWLREKRGDVLSVALLLAVIRITLYKHGVWVTLTALFSLAIGLAVK